MRHSDKTISVIFPVLIFLVSGCSGPSPVLPAIEHLFKEAGIKPKGVWLSAVGKNKEIEDLLRERISNRKIKMIGKLQVLVNSYGKKALSGWSDGSYLKDEKFSMNAGPVTVGCSIYLKGPQPPMATIIDHKHDGTSGLFLSIVRGNKVKMHVGNGQYSKTVESREGLKYNQWYMITAVNDGTNLYLFINGRLSEVALDTRVMLNKRQGLTIGQWFGGSGRSLRQDTLLKDVFIVDQALTAGQIYFLFHGGGGNPAF